jgi:hypothetical protein
MGQSGLVGMLLDFFFEPCLTFFWLFLGGVQIDPMWETHYKMLHDAGFKSPYLDPYYPVDTQSDHVKARCTRCCDNPLHPLEDDHPCWGNRVTDHVLIRGLDDFKSEFSAEAEIFLDEPVVIHSKTKGTITTRMSDHYGMWALVQKGHKVATDSAAQCSATRDECLVSGHLAACDADYHLCLSDNSR